MFFAYPLFLRPLSHFSHFCLPIGTPLGLLLDPLGIPLDHLGLLLDPLGLLLDLLGILFDPLRDLLDHLGFILDPFAAFGVLFWNVV